MAKELGLPYVDGDNLHPKENIDKMSDGIPLDDNDRWPWLRKIREEGVKACRQHSAEADVGENKQRGLVVGCSSLKKSYRRILRGKEEVEEDNNVEAKHDPFQFVTRFVYISGSRDELFERMKKRTGHYMKVEMLESQLTTLEPPDPNTEEGIIVVDLMDPTTVQVEKAIVALESTT